jgi:hypothetical protein
MSRRPGNPLDTTLPSSNLETEEEYKEEVQIELDTGLEILEPEIGLNAETFVEPTDQSAT